MKKNIFIISIFFLINYSCDLLEEIPEDRLVINNFYNTPSDAIAGINSIYQPLVIIYSLPATSMLNIITDNMKQGLGGANPAKQDIEFLRHTSQNIFVEGMWQYHYLAINRANVAIVNIEKMSMDVTLQKRLLGEAHFLRGLFYFNLVQLYGDVPLILDLKSVQDALVPRAPKDIVYNQIIEDLKFAGEYLPINYGDQDIGRATMGAAKILLGKVFLTKHDYQLAVEKLAEVVNNQNAYGYGLHESFGNNWKIETENGKEMVFNIQYTGPPGVSNQYMRNYGPRYSIGAGLGVAGLFESDIPTVDLYNSYLNEDTRKGVTFKMQYTNPVSGRVVNSSIPLIGKYYKENEPDGKLSDINYHIIRYADAVLLYAEALNEIGQTNLAIPILNRIRERAFGNTNHNYSMLSQEEFRTAIALERRLEFADEGQRFFDLVRTGKFVEVMKAHGTLEASLAEANKTEITNNVSEKHMLYPIPQREIDINPLLIQNPGY